MKKSIISLLIILTSTPSWGASELNQAIVTKVPRAVSVTVLSSANTGAIDPLSGNLLSAVEGKFQIQTNDDDSGYNFILQASVNTQSGPQNAYAQASGSPILIFGNNNPSFYPTLASINDIKSLPASPSGNPNAIAYNSTATMTNFQNIAFQNLPVYGGYCYKLKVGSAQSGTVTNTAGTTPYSNTYSIDNDRAGTYTVTLIMSAYSL